MRISCLVLVFLARPTLADDAPTGFNRRVYCIQTQGVTYQELADAGVTFVSHVAGTVCRLMTEDQYLYPGLVCTQSEMAHLRAAAKSDVHGLGAKAPADDSIEIYLDARRVGRRYFRLCLNTAGVAKCDTATGGWTPAVTQGADQWTKELRIPFSVVGGPPRPGELFGFNSCRKNETGHETSSWSWTQRSFAKPERFGGLLFSTGGH